MVSSQALSCWQKLARTIPICELFCVRCSHCFVGKSPVLVAPSALSSVSLMLPCIDRYGLVGVMPNVVSFLVVGSGRGLIALATHDEANSLDQDEQIKEYTGVPHVEDIVA
jgi:hypothetical protein